MHRKLNYLRSMHLTSKLCLNLLSAIKGLVFKPICLMALPITFYLYKNHLSLSISRMKRLLTSFWVNSSLLFALEYFKGISDKFA